MTVYYPPVSQQELYCVCELDYCNDNINPMGISWRCYKFKLKYDENLESIFNLPSFPEKIMFEGDIYYCSDFNYLKYNNAHKEVLETSNFEEVYINIKNETIPD